jgi:uncharacterized protein
VSGRTITMNDTISFDKVDKYGPQSYRGTYSVAPNELDRAEMAEPAEIAIEAKVEKGSLGGEYVIDGTSTFTAALACSRCLDPTPFANSSPFHVRFRPRPETSGLENDEVEITEAEELDVEYYSEREFPLRDLAIEQIQLSIPMKPLCDDKCLGLCSQCGANRNREECSCTAAAGDDRWGALRGLRDELAKKNES